MCGRFILQVVWSEVYEWYNLIRPEDRARNLAPRYNIAPTQDVLCVAEVEGERRLFDARWWLVPPWAESVQSKYPMFNARSEDAHTRPAFRDAFRRGRRCLIPADGYYEWTANPVDKGRDPHLIHLPDMRHFAFAGLWERNDRVEWQGSRGVTSCTILTAPAAPEIAHLHSRMPLILHREVWDSWLDPAVSTDAARSLYARNLGGDLVSYRVARAVNSSRGAEGPELIEPLADDAAG